MSDDELETHESDRQDHNPQPRYASLQQWLSWMETLHPSEIELGLERVGEVARRLGFEPLMSARGENQSHPQLVSIAGTNGKGSCVAALEQLLINSGAAVGAYTSPHLLAYNERIKINGQWVSDEQLCEAFARIDQARGDISLTYFEFGTLAAFELFRSAGVDYWLLEVGLGGRLDAVNSLWPDIAVLTSIALDHEQWLGFDREKIGMEKAGILRPGIPFVCAELTPTNSVMNAVREHQVSHYQIERSFGFQISGARPAMFVSTADRQHVLPLNFEMKLPAASLAAASQVFALLGFELTAELLAAGLADLTLPGRYFSVADGTRRLILDVAHNPAATEYLASKIHQDETLQKPAAVVAMMADKDIRTALQPLVHLIGHWYPVTLDSIGRAASRRQLADHLRSLGVAPENITECDSVTSALSMFDGDGVVFGSFYTVADAMLALQKIQ